eukprot:6521390-Karenia_brevis.AAC.1
MPLDLFLNMWDFYAARKSQAWSKLTLQEFHGCYWGSMKGTQGQSCVAQADVAQFYDSIQTPSLLSWAVQNGLNMAIAYVLLILHLLPQ